MRLRRATLKMRIDSAARSLAYSPSGSHLVVGLGGDRDAMVKEGTVVVLSASTLEILEEVCPISSAQVYVRSLYQLCGHGLQEIPKEDKPTQVALRVNQVKS